MRMTSHRPVFRSTLSNYRLGGQPNGNMEFAAFDRSRRRSEGQARFAVGSKQLHLLQSLLRSLPRVCELSEWVTHLRAR